ncbi:DEAD/DEAH box helicase family protein [Microbulbifer thermotolerans]|uniref:DEAD/DEAH box helicase family protein n=1 Tax=Microbulbifer thermotolerans TaxID=252514 RepID=UPI002673036B|nr:DEAD/DEAH box helicase family protein [Microbulbifer thermotolerans]WKT60703.1 DEAD/DEAH box helicase family protein [Microbulbifer thermotolerans]
MIDFSKIGTGNTVDTVLPPREIFNALPKKDAVKFQYPRDVQSQVWSKWHERRDENSLVIKMNTGSGKTVVGLLILKSCLNEGKSPAVYVCPDKYLVKQVIDAAKELGVEVTDDVNSPRFLSGKSILVINIYKLVNGKSVFGVGDEGAKLKISSLIVDDAHACLDTVEDQFTINIPSTSNIYIAKYTR